MSCCFFGRKGKISFPTLGPVNNNTPTVQQWTKLKLHAFCPFDHFSLGFSDEAAAASELNVPKEIHATSEVSKRRWR